MTRETIQSGFRRTKGRAGGICDEVTIDGGGLSGITRQEARGKKQEAKSKNERKLGRETWAWSIYCARHVGGG
jgi:hypothetical protein